MKAKKKEDKATAGGREGKGKEEEEGGEVDGENREEREGGEREEGSETSSVTFADGTESAVGEERDGTRRLRGASSKSKKKKMTKAEKKAEKKKLKKLAKKKKKLQAVKEGLSLVTLLSNSFYSIFSQSLHSRSRAYNS